MVVHSEGINQFNFSTAIPSVTVSAGKHGIITVTWDPLKALQGLQYRVHFRPTNGNVETASAKDLKVELQNLTLHMNYTIWVVAVNSDGQEVFVTKINAITCEFIFFVVVVRVCLSNDIKWRGYAEFLFQ